jgi:2-methylisocitrate lyase-like PEP mutase family enzyme
MTALTDPSSAASRLRALLGEGRLIVMPCCYDALSAKLIEAAGFPLTFMSGFAVAASRLALPDTGLISYGEMLDQGRTICGAVKIPVIGDGDTGYGNALNVKRTVRGYAMAGFAAVMIEDQHAPKRCGHIAGKEVVSRAEALTRMRAAVDAKQALRDEGRDILILARTDARATHGFEEALARAEAFAAAGADIHFIEALADESEMAAFCGAMDGPKMINLLEGGATPLLPPEQLEATGFAIAAFPLTLLSSALRAMTESLEALKSGRPPEGLMDFVELRRVVGFESYDREAAHYADGG